LNGKAVRKKQTTPIAKIVDALAVKGFTLFALSTAVNVSI
jgi:hypothetical protein